MPDTRPADIVRVISVPAGHAYARAIRPEPSSGVLVAGDPDPARPERPSTGVWWPHPGLEPSWLAREDFDLLHVHFGFDHRTPAQLSELVDHLRASGHPLVLTVHDLRSPHQPDSRTLDRQLDVLVPGADEVLTLTPWAARRIDERWGRRAQVSAHPPLVDPARSRGLRAGRRPVSGRTPVVAMSCKSLRPNCDPFRLLPALERAVRTHGARLRLLVHTDVVTGPGRRARGAVARFARARERGAEVVVHEPLSDDVLWTELAGQDVAVLPYRFGTHSGWLEACHDVGTAVAAPSFGGYADQGADAVYCADDRTVDEESLVDAVGVLVERARSGALAGEGPDGQDRRRRAAQVLHEQVYRNVVVTPAVHGFADAGGRAAHR